MAQAAPRRPFLRWFVVAIGMVALLAGLASLFHEPENRRIASALALHGVEAEAQILSVRVTTSRLPSQVAARTGTGDEITYYSATIALNVGTQHAEAEIYLTAAEYAAVEDGTLENLRVIALADDPSQVERNRGDRLAAAPTDRMIAFLLIVMGAVPVIGAGLGPMLLRRFGGR